MHTIKHLPQQYNTMAGLWIFFTIEQGLHNSKKEVLTYRMTFRGNASERLNE